MDQERISETVSEKPRRGRRRIMGPLAISTVDVVAPEVKSERGRQNVYYRQLALGALAHDPRFRWIADEDGMMAGDKSAWRPGVLAELGRIWVVDEDLMLRIAELVCEIKPPTTRAAVALIRRARLRSMVGTRASVVKAIRRSIGGFLSRYPDTPWEVVVDALQQVCDEGEPEAPDHEGRLAFIVARQDAP